MATKFRTPKTVAGRVTLDGLVASLRFGPMTRRRLLQAAGLGLPDAAPSSIPV
mgnify:CR=1 FL=1